MTDTLREALVKLLDLCGPELGRVKGINSGARLKLLRECNAALAAPDAAPENRSVALMLSSMDEISKLPPGYRPPYGRTAHGRTAQASADMKLAHPINFEAWARNAVSFIRENGMEQDFKDWSGGFPCPVATPPGWALVPVEITDKMNAAMIDAIQARQDLAASPAGRIGWRAALAAAPKPPVTP